MKWLEEVRATRRTLTEIGLMVVVREVFANRFSMAPKMADDTLGTGWRAVAERLGRAGMMEVAVGRTVRLRVVAPGDRKRARCRSIGRKNRAMARFEARVKGKESDS